MDEAARNIADSADRSFALDDLDWRGLLSTNVFDRVFAQRADGVILYFADYAAVAAADDGSAVARMVKLVEAVGGRLDPDMTLGIAFDLPAVGANDPDDTTSISEVFLGLSGVLGLAERATAEGQPRVRVETVFVFLDRPTRDTKRRLHAGVQSAFAGATRTRVLRMVVPVVPPNGHGPIHHLVPDLRDGRVELDLQSLPFSQFDDDLSFYKDNFKGVGFWPPILDDQADYDEVLPILAGVFGETSADFLTSWAQAMPAVCDIVCPNRIAFRTLLVAMLLGILVIALVARFYCRFCTEVAERFLLVPVLMTLFVLAFFVVAVCDPWLRTEAFEVLMLMVAGLLAYVVVTSIARIRREDDP